MSSLIERYENLNKISNKLIIEHETLKKTKENLENQYKELEEKLKNVTSDYTIQQLSINALKEIIDKISGDHIRNINDFLNDALSFIFYDRDYKAQFVTSSKRNTKALELVLIEHNEGEEDLKIPIDGGEGVGGGILAVIGFILQVYYLNYYKQANIMFCDESFTQVSSQYVPNLMAFIQKLNEEQDFILVLISHDERLIEYADYMFTVNRGEIDISKNGGEDDI